MYHYYIRVVYRSRKCYGIGLTGNACCIGAVAVHAGPNQYTGPAYSVKACFMTVADTATTVNKDRWAGSISSQCSLHR